MIGITSVNEFVLRFANVNGTGSASANGMVAKSFFRLGLPIGPKNMFPSNIQGLPTWYEVRVSERGYTGRRGGVDIAVAMNPQTFDKDSKDVNRGGYLIYDSTRFLPSEKKRDDIFYIGIPMTALARDTFPNPKARAMLKNVVYVGALSALLDIDLDVYRKLVSDQFAKKPKLIPDNIKALEIGYNYARDHYECPIGIRVEARDLVKDKIILGGNDAAGLGCVYAGATVAGWYPITPSTSLVDAFAKFCGKYRVGPDGTNHYAIVQAEDEISAVGMVLGASWNGARAFTATSGPGISLMSEFIGYAYYAEIPAVIFNIQRCGPSTGMPTRTQQSDLLLCAYASHGDTKHMMLFPSDPNECFDFAALAFDLADMYQTPVFVMSDLELGMNEYVCEPLKWDDSRNLNRGKVLPAEALAASQKPFYRYLDSDGDGVPYRTYPGVHPKAAYFTRGSGHDRFGRYTEDGALYQENMDRINKKFHTALKDLPKPVLTERGGKNKDWLIVSCGTTSEPLSEALDLLQSAGVAFDDVRLRSFPFDPSFSALLDTYANTIVIDQNRDSQLRSLILLETNFDPKRLHALRSWDGMPVMALDLMQKIRDTVGAHT